MKQIIEKSIWRELEQEHRKLGDFNINKLKLTSQDNEVLNSFFKKFLDPSENFPEGARHTTIEKNFAIYIVSNKIPLEQIKKAYKSKGFDINSLTSQIKGVISGIYKNPHVNVGELVNWCKQNRPDLVELLSDTEIDESNILRKSDLIFPTAHLPYYKHIESITQIFGKDYKHLHKLLCYHFISGIVPETHLIVRKGQIEIDLRDYLFLVHPSGSAKGNVMNIAFKIKKDLGHEIVSLVSYHEEQLLGRIINRGTKRKPEWKKNHGLFISDEILIDECKSLLTQNEKESSRNYLLKAMDKYTQNLIYKRLTENLNHPDETLSYYPKFNAVMGTQPFNFHEDNIVLNGFLKRVTTDYLPVLERPDEDFDSRLDSSQSLPLLYDEFIANLKTLSDIGNPEWSFSDDFNNTFKECFRNLRYAGLHNLRKKRNYTKLIEWQLQDRLLRKSCLLALLIDRNTHVTARHVELAFIDLLEDFIIELEFVNDKVYGDLDYGSVWGTADKKEENILKWLYSYGATSEEESEISIKALQQEIRQIYKVEVDQARKVYYKLINKELIKSKPKVGQYKSKVWLINIPSFQSAHSGKSDTGGIKTFYFNLVNKYFQSAQTGNAPRGEKHG